jgi:transcriptional regulator with XRE-family HTH domain
MSKYSENSVFSKRLKETRVASGKEQREVADHLGIIPRTVRFYESGGASPSMENLEKLADLFDISIDFLFGRTDDPKSHKGTKS